MTTAASRPSPPDADTPFQAYSEWYDLLYADKDYEGEAAYVAARLAAAGVPAGRLLELGSGTGRHARHLAARGYTVTGVERSPGMLARAQAEHIDGTRFVAGDLRDTRLDERFDAVLALFHVISYLTRDDDLTQAFAGASHHLNPGGVFLFDVWHGPAVVHEGAVVRVKHAENAAVRVRRAAEPRLDPAAGLVDVRYTVVVEPKAGGPVETVHERHVMRYLFPADVTAVARSAGFVVESSEAFGTGEPPSDRTWGVMYLLRKPS
jgi:SAM-dependent methyltransferase